MTGHLEKVVRNIVRRLRPAGLDELGLAAAVESCVDGWRQRLPSVKFRVEVGEEIGPLDEAINITLYRLIQEGLTNVAKHAHATCVDIVMHQRSGAHVGAPEVVLVVQDNGVGTREAVEESGLGIVGMRERVEGLAGRFDLTPASAGGFGFTAWLPLRHASAA